MEYHYDNLGPMVQTKNNVSPGPTSHVNEEEGLLLLLYKIKNREEIVLHFKSTYYRCFIYYPLTLTYLLIHNFIRVFGLQSDFLLDSSVLLVNWSIGNRD